MKRIVLSVVLLLLVIALPLTMAKKSRKQDSPKLLYAKKCAGSCHRLYKPKEYTSEQWVKILDEMSTLAKLTDEEKRTIKDYLLRQEGSPSAE
jgi:hypothetical protein